MRSPHTPPAAEDASPGTVTTFDAFARFARTVPPAPPQPGQPACSPEERLAYHSQFVTVRTPAIESLSRSVRTLMILGRSQRVTARPSLIVTGPATTGKTTALLEVGRTCHLAPHPPRHPRGHQRARGLRADAARRHRQDPGLRVRPLPRPPRHHPHDHRADHDRRLPHLHRGRSPAGADRRDPPAQPPQLQRSGSRRLAQGPLTERVGATFVYAGIDVTASMVFSGVRGAQLAGRASLINCGALPARAGEREPFRELIAAMEAALDLHAHRTGSLPRLAPYLHERTAGRIGSLARLIRQAAIEAILDGTERIIKTRLDSIALDHLTEEHYRPRTTASRPTRPRSR